MSVSVFLRSINPDVYQRAKAEPSKALSVVFEPNNGEYDDLCNLQTAWHAVHFVLSGNPYNANPKVPLSRAIMGGEKIGPQAFGLDPLKFLSSVEVNEVSIALDAADTEVLVRAWPSNDDDYDDNDEEDDDDDDFEPAKGLDMVYGLDTYSREDILGFVDHVKRFYRESAKRGNAVVQYCS